LISNKNPLLRAPRLLDPNAGGAYDWRELDRFLNQLIVLLGIPTNPESLNIVNLSNESSGAYLVSDSAVSLSNKALEIAESAFELSGNSEPSKLSEENEKIAFQREVITPEETLTPSHGLGSMSTQDKDRVDITGGIVKGIILSTLGGQFIISTDSSLDDYFSTNISTLTNSPITGNPSKWIAINDNGTTRYIPAW
jgi:hypothetical protein